MTVRDWFFIAAIIVLASLYTCKSCQYNKCVRGIADRDTISVRVDTVIRKILDEKIVYVPEVTTVTRPGTVKIIRDSFTVVKENNVISGDIEDALIQHYTERTYIDSLKGSWGYVVVFDTLLQNSNIGRSWQAAMNERTITKEITLTQPLTTKVYFSLEYQTNKQLNNHQAGAGLMLLSKRQKTAYEIGAKYDTYFKEPRYEVSIKKLIRF